MKRILRLETARGTSRPSAAVALTAALLATACGGAGTEPDEATASPESPSPAQSEPASAAPGADIPREKMADITPASEQQVRRFFAEGGSPIAARAAIMGTRETPVLDLGATAEKVASVTVANHSFCFQQTTQYGDAGKGEDVWPEISAARAMSFAFFTWGAPDGTTGFGILNVFGCATFQSAPVGNWSFGIYSAGAVGASNIAVYGNDPGILSFTDSNGTWAPQSVLLSVTLAANSPNPQVPPPFKAWLSQPLSPEGFTTKPGPLNLYPAIALALLEHNTNAWTYRYTMDTTHAHGWAGGSTRCDLTNAASTTIGPGYSFPSHTFLDNKIQSTHELGHAVFCAATGNGNSMDDQSYAQPNTCTASNGGHNSTTIGYQGGAFAEAWANYYSADTWNTDAPGSDCDWGGLDCARGGSFPVHYAQSTCSPLRQPAGCTAGSAGCDVLGVEWDWTREFWAMRTSSAQPSMNDTFAWFRAALPGMNRGNVFLKLDAAANTNTSVPASVKTAWNATKAAQGVNAQ